MSGQDLQVSGLGVNLDQIGDMAEAAEVEANMIDLGSAYAKSLGFVDDVEYVVDDSINSSGHGASKKKKKKKKKGGNKHLNGSKIDLEEHDHDDDAEDEEEGHLESGDGETSGDADADQRS